MKYSGIDLHSNNSVVTVTDEEDRVMAEKRLPNDLATILGFLLPWRDELVGVVVESTYNWYWLVDGLQEAGYRVHLAHCSAIKKYEGLGCSSGWVNWRLRSEKKATDRTRSGECSSRKPMANFGPWVSRPCGIGCA